MKKSVRPSSFVVCASVPMAKVNRRNCEMMRN